jgi:hypothetical protein
MNALNRLEKYPDWPARMTAPVAAAYMSVSETKFVADYGHLGKKDGGNKFWARVQLDRLVAEQFVISVASPVPAESDPYEMWKAGRKG